MAATTPPNASAPVAVPLNFADVTELDNWIPCATVAKPDDINAVPVESVELGVNARLDTTPTTVSFETNLSIPLFTPALSFTVSGMTAVTPDPATVVGPISVQADPE